MAKIFMITDKTNDVTGVISNVDENTVNITWEDERSEDLTTEELNSLLETEDYEVDEVEINEETPAQASIHTHPTADQTASGENDGNPKTKFEWISAILGNLANQDTSTLTKLFDAQQAMIGGEGDRAGLGGNSDSNKNSINMKPSAAEGSTQGSGAPKMHGLGEDVLIKLQKEEQDVIFAESTLTEEAKEKIKTLFEAAVSARLTQETIKLQEKYENTLEEKVKEIVSSLIEGIDSYMDHVADKFIEENEIAIESTLRTELTEEFIEKFRKLLQDSYINIPEDKLDVLEAVIIENEDLKEKLNAKMNEEIEKNKIITAMKKKEVVNSMSEGLTLVQKDKLKTMTEGVVFDNEETFKKKLQIIKEGFVNEKTNNKDSNIVIIEGMDRLDSNNVTVAETTDPAIAAVARQLRS